MSKVEMVEKTNNKNQKIKKEAKKKNLSNALRKNLLRRKVDNSKS